MRLTHHGFVVVCAAILMSALMSVGCVRDYGPARPAAPIASQVIYTVVEGDTVVSIGRRFGVMASVIIDANDITKRDLPLTPGRQLVIPGAKPLPPEPIAAPTPAPVPPAAPVAASTDWYVPRSAWAQEAIILERINPMSGKPNRITVHHSNMPGDTDSDTKGVLRKIDREHHKAIGRNGEAGACIGYHFLIAPNGTVYEGRPLKYQGAHAGGSNNVQNIGVCLLGNFEDRPVPAAQKAQLIKVLDRFRETYGIKRANVFGHKDFNPPDNHHTDCPGHYLQPIVIGYRNGQFGSEPTMGMASSASAP